LSRALTIVLQGHICYTSNKKSLLASLRSTGKSGRSEVSCARFAEERRASDIRPSDQNRCFSCLEELRPWRGNKGFSESEGIMSVLSILASSLSALFGLYCVIWSIVASSDPTAERAGSAFLGVLFLLLAFVYVRIILPHEQ
jgi:hypothetical protein